MIYERHGRFCVRVPFSVLGHLKYYIGAILKFSLVDDDDKLTSFREVMSIIPSPSYLLQKDRPRLGTTTIKFTPQQVPDLICVLKEARNDSPSFRRFNSLIKELEEIPPLKLLAMS